MALFRSTSVDDLLKTWAADGGPTEDEIVKYATAVSEQLTDSAVVEQFIKNVEQVGTWANEVDEAFDRVSRSFTDMVNKYGGMFPGFSSYRDRFDGFKSRWVQHLYLSRDVASENVAILKRFDQVYLDMIDMIVTVQDCKDVVLELEVFINEKHDRAEEMYAGFQNLSRDLAAFVPELDDFIVETGNQLSQEAKRLQGEIESLNSQIQVMDAKIKEATTALIACGACICLLGVIVAGSVLASYQSDRDELAGQLSAKETELAGVNEAQDALPKLQSDIDGVKPDIELICGRLMLFAEIWTAVRSQAVQFQEVLRAANAAPTNMGFKQSVKLARNICGPLENGLERYATQLTTRMERKAAQT